MKATGGDLTPGSAWQRSGESDVRFFMAILCRGYGLSDQDDV